MQPSTRVLVLVGVVLSLSLTATTSVARYRATLGPQQCCQTQCKHHAPVRQAAAMQCCTTHLAVLSQAKNAGAAPDLVAAPALVVASVTVPPPDLAAAHAPRLGFSRPPPGTLLAHHTSLVR